MAASRFEGLDILSVLIASLRVRGPPEERR
jgi:hypothetical protein